MKKNLCMLIIAVCGLAMTRTHAQCAVTNLSTEVSVFNTSTCAINFDLSWEQEINNGNKFAYVHLWTQALYHTPAGAWSGIYGNPSSAPEAAQLVNALVTIVIENNNSATPTIGTSYHPNTAVLPLSAGLSVVKTPLGGGKEKMTVSNISITIPGACDDALPLTGDVWASQSANGKNVHCVSEGMGFSVTDPLASALPLPVKLTKFTVTRKNQSVDLHWETETEQNNKGFQIERNQGSGWESFAFITTKAVGGNSSSRLSYSFSHINTSNLITQYRLKQVDLNGQVHFSPVRTITGLGKSNFVNVYPNPATNGKVNVSFGDDSPRDIILIDMNGRAVRQWLNYAAGDLQIQINEPGIYSLRTVVRASGEQKTARIAVSER